MKTAIFTKYQGTGNDFILIDNRTLEFPKGNVKLISFLCDRKFGIGSDGIILIENHSELDFEMIFFNPDGSRSFCGNGSRCAVSFAADLKIIEQNAVFQAIDGPHEAVINHHSVRVKMADVSKPEKCLHGSFINTGSPHYVEFVTGINDFPVFKEGKSIREKTEVFGPEGTNVNFVEELGIGSVFVRTFERGVENETLSCGTGVTAAALVYGMDHGVNSVTIQSIGGHLLVEFEKNGDNGFNNIYLSGPAEKVFHGEACIPQELQ